MPILVFALGAVFSSLCLVVSAYTTSVQRRPVDFVYTTFNAICCILCWAMFFTHLSLN